MDLHPYDTVRHDTTSHENNNNNNLISQCVHAIISMDQFESYLNLKFINQK
jgi:hypothetical protein